MASDSIKPIDVEGPFKVDGAYVVHVYFAYDSDATYWANGIEIQQDEKPGWFERFRNWWSR